MSFDSQASATALDGFVQHGTIAGATVNLAVTTIGAGVLSLPTAFASSGIMFAIAVVVVTAVFTVISIKYIAECVQKLQLDSYEEISRDLLGPKSEQLARWMLILYLFGACVGYIVLVGELLDPLAPHVMAVFPFVSAAYVRQFSMALFWVCTMFPLSLTRDLNRLAYSSLLAICAAIYLAIFIIYRYVNPLEGGKLGPKHGSKHFHDTDCNTVVPQLFKFDFLTLLSLPILMYSFDCQTLVFQLFHSLQEPSYQKMTRVGAYAIAIASSAYLVIGLFGYLSFGDCVKGNILMNYDPKVDHGAAVAYLMYSAPVIMAYAITLFPCRDAIFQWRYAVTPKSPTKMESWPFYAITAGLSFSCLVVAIFVPGILTVISLLGGFCSSTLCFTFPALYAVRLDVLGVMKASLGRKLTMYLMMSLGVFGCILGTAVASYKTYQGYE